MPETQMRIAALWGSSGEEQPVRALIAAAAETAPAAVAFAGAGGPIEFGVLAERVESTAQIFEASGVDAEAAVAAAITPLAVPPGSAQAETASRVAAAVADIRSAAAGILGTTEWTTLPPLLRSAAHRHPDRVAVVDEAGASRTYADLDWSSDRIAAALARAGVTRDAVVALAFPPTADMIVAILGVLKSGAAYVALDLASPAERIAYVVADSQAVSVVADDTSIGALPALDVPVERFGDLVAADAADAAEVVPVGPGPESAAYVIYTSGSTGQPKGVVVQHNSAVRFLRSMQELVPFTADDTIGLFASYTFDASVWSMWSALAHGGRLIVVGTDTRASPDLLAGLIERESITSINLTPSVFYPFTDAVRPGGRVALSDSLRYLHLAGEALDIQAVRGWFDDREQDGREVRLFNIYGPTEATVQVTLRALTPDYLAEAATADIGFAIPGTEVTILDDRLRPVPDGVPGEIYVCGPLVTRGYLRRFGLTAASFVADPLAGSTSPSGVSLPPGARMYRTGDMGLRRGGAIEYLGRRDGQVKLRGYRIELGEVEAALAAAPTVVAAGAAVREADGGQQVLVGYVVSDAAPPDTQAIRDSVRAHLPGYMVPDVVLPLDALPLSTSGKLDRAALPAPDFGVEAEYVEPATDAERDMVRIVEEVLGVSPISVTASIFDLGGNSLIAAQVAALCGEELDLAVSVRDVFDAPTVRELASRVAGSHRARRPELVAHEPRPAVIPLSHAQRRIWFISELDPETAIYNMPLVLRFDGTLDPAALAGAFDDVVARHEVMRTRFGVEDGVPYQEVLVHGSYAPDVAIDPPTRLEPGRAPLDAAVAEVAGRGFDLRAAPPVRARLFQRGPDDFIFVLIVHHVIADGASLAPLSGDLVAAYVARTAGEEPRWPALPVQYADFTLWSHELLGDPDSPASVAGGQLGFWEKELAGVPEAMALPTDRPRPPVQSQRAAAHAFDVDPRLVELLDDFARHRQTSRFMVLHALWAALLHRLTGDRDIVIGTPYTGRGERALDDLVGMFINTVALRTPVDPAATFAELVSTVRARDLAALDNSDVPFDLVVERVDPARSTSHAPIFQVMLLLHEADDASFALPGVAAEIVEVYRDLTDNDMAITFIERGAGEESGLHGVVEYNTDLFDETTIRSFTTMFDVVARELLTAPETPVGDAVLLAPAQRDAVLTADRGARIDVPDWTLADAVAAQIAATPDAIALSHRDRDVTYREFGARVATLARELIGAGVGPDVAVAVCIPRSVEMMVAIHAVVAAGGQYVPIDVDTPAERFDYMVETAGARVVLISAHEQRPAALGTADDAVRILPVDAEAPVDERVAPVTDTERLAPLRTDHAVYTIFTSGSTGRPKGVTLPHDAVVNRLHWGLHQLPITGAGSAASGPNHHESDDLVVLKTPYTFDCSAAEIFAPLMNGTPLLVADADGHLDPVYMAELMAQRGVTMAHFVPSMLAVFLELAGESRLARLDRLRIISTTGEALPPSVAAQVRAALPHVTLYNLYGPTEAAIEITYAEIGDDIGHTVPIGVPVWNSSAHVLDPRLHPVPDGVAGELYVGGVQLARGYAARPDLTADRFVADPFAGESAPPGARLYRTGDLVRRNRSGDLEYLGRTDFQVKLRGQRVELGEIEAALTQAPGVVHAAATVAKGPDGGEHLVAYLAGAPEEGGAAAIDLAAVKAAIAGPLPEFMRPTVWMLLDEAPRNSAGKLDRNALPPPEFTAGEYVAPATPAEKEIAEIVAEVIGTERVGVTDSFFDVGGNSLSATRVMARVGEAFGVDLGVRALFDAPTVRELARVVDEETGGQSSTSASVPLVAQERPERIPLSFAQQRMWFINQFDTSSAAYNIPVVLDVTESGTGAGSGSERAESGTGSLDLAALRLAAHDVLARHEVLRTTYPADENGQPYQLIADSADAAERLDFAVVEAGDPAGVVAEEVGRGFDVSVQLPIRIRLIRQEPDRSTLVVVLHHIAADGESGPVLAADLVTAYRARAVGDAPGWAPLPIQYADYALWQTAVLGSDDDDDSLGARQTGFWTAELAGVPEVLDLPADRPRPESSSGASGSVDFGVGADVRDRLVELGREHGASLFMVAHAAVATLLARLSATTDITIATPVAGRGLGALDRLVGMFVNTLVLRSEFDPASTAGDLLVQIRDRDLAAFDHADLPFEKVVEAIDPVRSDSFGPLAQVLLVFVAAEQRPITVDGLTLTPVDPGAGAAKFDLTFGVADRQGAGLGGSLVYAADLFDESTARWFARGLEAVLTALARTGGTLRLGDVDLLDDAQHRAVAAASVGPAVPLLPETIPDAVDAALRGNPDAIGLVTDDAEVANGRFAGLVAHYARILIAEHGVGPDVAVAVCMPRGLGMVLAIHAVLAAGGQYVPVDTSLPPDRADYMFDDAQVRVVLLAPGDEPAPMAGRTIATVAVDPDAAVTPESSAPLRAVERLAPLRGDNAAYTIFTSGSTGRPKGVTVSQRSVLNRLRWGLATFPLGADDTVILKTPYTFDVSVPELFAPLLAGARMFIARDGGHADPDYLIDVLETKGITSVHFVPSMLAVFLDVVDDSRLRALTGIRYVFASGEALPASLAKRTREIWPSSGLHDLFGPTEAAVEVSHADLDVVGHTVPIGYPIWNTATYVLDSRLAPVGTGVPGELYLGGVQLARGYAARPDQTADRFVADPFAGSTTPGRAERGGHWSGVSIPSGARMYRTGDLVARNADGALEYLGRTDFQVKLRGQRIELGEVESVLAAVPGVVHAAATVASAPTGAEHLVAYLSGHSDIDLDEAKSSVAQALPEYMVPTVWQVLDEVTLNSAGKLDRRALPEPDFASAVAGADPVAPRSAAERRIADIVAGVLGVDRVGVTDSFFALGGDSIMSIQLSSLLRAEGFELGPRDIFEQRTVRGLAALASTAEATVLDELPGGGIGEVDLTPTISWMLENSPRPGAFRDYSQALVLALPAEVDDDGVVTALDAVIARHPMLSARLADGGDGRATMTAGNDVGSVADRLTVASSPAVVGSAEFDDALRAGHREALARLDPASGAMVAAAVVRADSGVGRLILAIHHAVVDAVSWRGIVGDLVAASARLGAGEPADLPPASGTSMRRWARALAELGEKRRNEIPLWREHLPISPALALPEPGLVAETSNIAVTVPSEVTETVLTRVADAFRAGVDDVLLAALLIAVARLDGGSAESAAVLVEGHGRVESVAPGADLSSTVGWFTSVSPVAVGTADLLRDDLVRAVKAVKEAVAARPDDGIGFGPLRWGPGADPDLAHRPLPPIVFNYLGAATAGAAAAGGVDEIAFAPVADAPALPGTITGEMIAPALAANVNTVSDPTGRRFAIDLAAPERVLDAAALTALGESMSQILADLVDEVSERDPGPSPSDLPGLDLDQDEIDAIRAAHPGAEIWPLSPLQHGLLFQSELAAESAGGTDPYLMQAVVELRGDLDGQRLRAAAQQLLDRTAVLRSAYRRTANGQGVAVVAPHVEAPWRTVDLRDIDDERARSAADEVARDEGCARFDLAHSPLIRFVHVLLPGEASKLVITNHHLLADGWSSPLVLGELFASYADPARADTGERTDYRDFLEWVAGRDEEASRQAWREFLADVSGPTLVAPRTPRPDEVSVDHRITLGPETTAKLTRFGREHEITTATLLQFAWAVVLHRFTGADTVIFGETVSGRPPELAGAESMIGLLINTVPVAVTVDGDATVLDALGDLGRRKAGVLEHQHLSLTAITAAAAGPKASSPLFDTLTVYESYPVDARGLSAAGEALGVHIADATASDSTHYPLTLAAAPDTGDGVADIALTLKYLPSLFSRDEAASFAAAVTSVLAAVAEGDGRRVADLPLVAPDAPAGPPLRPGVEPVLLRDLFAVAASKHRGRVAVIAGSSSMTYRKLDEASNRLARVLLEDGVGPEVLVALAIPRSVELLIAIWAVAKTGGGYVPIDPDYPPARVTAMLEDCGAETGLTTSAADGLPGLPGGDWHRIDGGDLVTRYRAADSGPLAKADLPPTSVDNTAYVIFTSGSTGRPKGVAVTHRGLANFATQEARRSGVGEGARVLGFASPSFDASVLEYLLATISGGALVYRSADAVGGEALERVVAGKAVTHGFLTPSVVASLDPDVWESLHALFVGGEAVPESLVEQWASAGRRVQNLYGPTETTIGITISDPLQPREPVVLGEPLDGVGLMVLDDRLRPVPHGFPGELYVYGNALSRGYLERPGLTADRFVANPYTPGSRMYRTGDLVTWCGDPRDRLVLRYHGRNDDQIKLRGLRLELGEIEAALARADGVTAAVVVGVRADGAIAEPGDNVVSALAAYIVAGPEVDIDSVREQIAADLPAHAVPSTITPIGTLPLTPVGKLDRRALPAPTIAAGGAGRVEPAGPVESAIAGIFAELLGTDDVGATDSFFLLGGNSLSAAQLVARVGHAFDTRIGIADLFDAPTVRGLAAVVGESTAPALPPITPGSSAETPIPLTYAQQRIWFINRYDPDSGAYNIPVLLRMRGAVDIDRLRAALLRVMTRQTVLRTVFPIDSDGRPRQQPVSADVADQRLDWAVVDTADAARAAFSDGFDLTRDLPIRVRIVREGPDSAVVAIVVHHIAADGQSMPVLARDLLAAYGARGGGPGEEPEVTYGDYARWQRENLGAVDEPESVLGRQWDYWRQRLAGLPEVTDLPMDRPRGAEFDPAGGRLTVTIDPDAVNSLRRLAEDTGTTVFMVLHAALTVLVARLTGSGDVVVGTAVAGRGDRALDALVGMFVNTVILRTAVDPSHTAAEVLASVKATDVEAMAHADLPFEELVEALAPARSRSHSPLFQIGLNHVLVAADTATTLEVDGVAVEQIDPGPLPAKVDLTVDVRESVDAGEPIRAEFTYATALFDEETVAGFAGAWQAILSAMTADPSMPVGDVELLPEGLGGELVPAHGPAPSAPATVRELLASVGPDPSRAAVVEGDVAVSYADFEARTNRLARLLVERGIGAGDVVAVAMRRSIDSVAATWAVLKAGAAYLPVDPRLPSARVTGMLDDAQVRFGLTRTVESGFSAPGEWVAVDSAETVEALSRQDATPVSDAELVRVPTVDDVAYVVFTSGSTGRPKGVAVTHRGIANLVGSLRGLTGTEVAEPRVLHVASPSFDAAFFEMAWAYFGGATLVVSPADVFGGRELAGVIAGGAVTHAVITPSVLRTVEASGVPGLRVIATAGEELLPELVRSWTGRRFMNLYGPTETTVWATVSEAAPDEPVVIGRPVAGIGAMVLDARLRPVLPGVVGELYLAGDQLAAGYLGRPGLTAGTFVACPFGPPGSRMYATGDLVRWRSAGGQWQLEFAGRDDFQVKVNGQRVELGEIDAVIGSYAGVASTVTVGNDDQNGVTRLVTYVVGTSLDVETAPALIVDHAREHLPTYMVPSAVVVLDALPLTAVGKLDRTALPTPEFGAQTPFEEPGTPTEHAVAEVFAAITGADRRVGARDSFFDLGGTSLAATRAAAQLADRLGVDVTVRDLFDEPEVAGLARLLGARDRRTSPPLGPRDRPTPLPLSATQRRMWFLNQFDTDSAAYNIPIPVRLRGELDPAVLREAVGDVMARHEVLRTVYPSGTDGPRQEILAADTARARLDAAAVGSSAELLAAAGQGFDVGEQLPLRVRWHQHAEDGEPILDLLVVVHHIAFDGQSAPVFVGDLVAAYQRRAGAGSEASGQAPLPVQYADYVLWQLEVLGDVTDPDSEMARQFAHWRERLADLPAVTNLPMDRPRPAVADQRGARLRIPIDESTVAGLAELAARHGVTTFMTHHALLSVLVARMAATDDVVIGTPIDGRTETALHGLVGMFVNTLVLRTRVDAGMRLDELLAHVRGVDVEAFDNAAVHFEQLVEALAPERSTAHAPLFQIALAVTDASAQPSGSVELERAGVRVEPLPADVDEEKVDLTLSVVTGGERDENYLEFSYATALFDESTVRRFAQVWQRIATAAIADPGVPVGDIDIVGSTTEGATSAHSGGRVDATKERPYRDPVGRGPGPGGLDTPTRSARRHSTTEGATTAHLGDSTTEGATTAHLGDSTTEGATTAHLGDSTTEGATAAHLGGRVDATEERPYRDPVGRVPGEPASQVYRDLVGRVPGEPASQVYRDPVSETGTLVDILASRDLDPSHPALICGDAQLDYAEFESRTNRVARALIARGVGPEDVVAVGIVRSIDFVVAVWGIVKSGAAYLPIDPAYPEQRIAYMLDDSRAALGITAEGALDAADGEWLDLAALLTGAGSEASGPNSSVGGGDAPVADGDRRGSVYLNTLAYLIYTSGSTGTPKAVAVSNAGIADLVAAHRAVTGSRVDDPDTRVLHVASPSFDASFFEMIWAVAAGHTLVIAPAEDYAGPALDEVIEAGEVTDMVITPSVLASLDPGRAETVRNLATAGEACPPELVERWAARGRRLFNFYGPSETTVWATRGRLLPGKPVTIGRAIGGFTAHVLDARLHPVPTGVVGELYLEADGLARGYLGRPGLTATSFVANPFAGGDASGSRLYATGDLVRMTASGDLEFAGRSDHQVKINGQRVELGEIEAVLADQPGVRQAVVLGVDDESGATRLVGYLVGDGSASVETDSVAAAAARRLPGHMVPAHLIEIPELPLTPSGKLDREALPVPDGGTTNEFVAPATDAERTLAGIVAGLLGRDDVSVTESFFALGGDSIMSIQLASAAKAAGLALTPREIFEYRTVRAMARAAAEEATVAALAEPSGGADGEVPLPPIVAWMIEQSDGPSDYADFSQAMVLRAPRGLDESGLRTVLAAVVQTHPALSATLDQDFATAILRTGSTEPDDAVWTSHRVVDSAVGSEAFADAVRSAHADALDHLHPTVGLLVAAVLLRDPSGDGRVVLAIHHLAVDAVSWPILFEDLATAWGQYRDGRPIELRGEATSVRGWFTAVAEEASARADELGYWLDRLPETPTDLGGRR
ncbi:putative non-ribosomal peptide synthetase [Gordonia araii NBRC 100433]|uniref:Putative non-ribosomal peptide synthetase n=1 Tax=Gordonia araii NBRC 100433 TaxID=1073574 RepID=G7GXV9_9ACTN|nr:non-ribosomal peptide synthetase [Gordonia araii]NNG98370.1 amino acid adenylation domain-containing protein [Gordonia araii NBRC 100433]GAB08434.1 putative non-ribosomal peptide synthetase [Gordonia araii NBRC 100433]